MKTQKRKQTIRNITLFTVIVIGTAYVTGYVVPYFGPGRTEEGTAGLGQLLWLITPLITVLALRTFGKDGWDDFGLRPNLKGNAFWWFATVLVFPASLALTDFWGEWTGLLSVNQNNLAAFVSALPGAFLFAAIKNIFEEFAWRGYLAPKVYSLKANIWLSHAVVGLIWGVWHLPFVIVLWPYVTADMMHAFVPLFLFGSVVHSIVYGEIRIATGSVWPAWLMHTIGNTLSAALLTSGLWQMNSGFELFVSPGGESIVGSINMLAIGIWLYKKRIKTQNEEG